MYKDEIIRGNEKLLFSYTNSAWLYMTASELGWTDLLTEPCDDSGSREQQEK